MRVPAPPGAVPGRREAPGARGPCEFSLRRDPSSASRPYPGSPFWGLVLWHRKRKDGFRWLRDSHAHHPPPRLLCPPNLRRRAHASQEASRTSAPSWGQPRMQKKRTVQVTESRAHGSPGGASKEVVSCERPRSPTRPPPDLPRVLRPDYCRIAFQQPVAFSTAQFAWLGPPSPKVITRIVPGTRVRRLLVLLARPLAGSGAAVPHVFKILLWFAGTCFPTIVVYSCCCCCCCCRRRRRRRHRQVA